MEAALSDLRAIVAEAARRFVDAPAVVEDGGRAVSYAELDRLSDEAAAGLGQRGLVEGDVLVLDLPAGVDYVAAYLAAAKIGAVTAGLNPRLTSAERARLVDLVRPRMTLDGEGVLEELRIPGAEPPEPLPDDPGRPVVIVFTSGTTGTPKAATFTNRQLSAISAMDAGEGWGGGGPLLVSTPLPHVGFMTKLPWYLRTASTVHLLRRWRAADALRLISEHRIPVVGAVAPQLALMLRDPDFDRYDLRCVSALIAGGAPSPPALVREARERFCAPYSIRYSSTESGGLGTLTAFDADDTEALHTVGRPRPGTELEIRDPEGVPLADGEIGEIWLRSPTVMAGYWSDPEATAETIVGGWLRTGDLGRIDECGCLRLAGRRKELYIRGGYNVYPAEVESVLSTHPLVEAVAVVPRDDEVMGELGVAVVVPRAAARPPSLAELRRHAGAELSSYKLPDEVVLTEELPLTSVGKLDRRALGRLLRGGGLTRRPPGGDHGSS